MHTYLFSDLHLTPERPEVVQAFLTFLSVEAPTAERLYCLGDLFEYWIGDDAASMVNAEPVLKAMRAVAENTECFFIAGNRDFLVGEQFEELSGFKILPDESIVDLYDEPTLLLHGDSMCTDDIAHMKFREEIVTNEERKQQFLSLPIPQRIEQAKMARMESNQHKSQVSMEIMDVTPHTVSKYFSHYDVSQMIHGHTHRQNTHFESVDGTDRTRHVLGDWGKTASIMIADEDGIRISNPPIQA